MKSEITFSCIKTRSHSNIKKNIMVDKKVWRFYKPSWPNSFKPLSVKHKIHFLCHVTVLPKDATLYCTITVIWLAPSLLLIESKHSTDMPVLCIENNRKFFLIIKHEGVWGEAVDFEISLLTETPDWHKRSASSYRKNTCGRQHFHEHWRGWMRRRR